MRSKVTLGAQGQRVGSGVPVWWHKSPSGVTSPPVVSKVSVWRLGSPCGVLGQRGEAPSGVLRPVLASPVAEGEATAGEGRGEGWQEDEGPGASPLRGEAEPLGSL